MSAFPCGDCNGDNVAANIVDFNYIFNYFFRGGPPPPEMAAADFDQYAGVTPLELGYLVRKIGCGGLQPSCPPSFPPYQINPDSAATLSHTQWIESDVTNGTLTIEFFTKTELLFVYLPVEIRIGNEVPQIDSVLIEYTPATTGTTSGYVVDTANGRALLWLQGGICPLLQSNSMVNITLSFSVNASSERRKVTIDWTKFSPLQASPPDSLIVPMAGLGNYTFEPVIGCCIGSRGDLNGNGGIPNVVDLNFAVNYIFRGSGNRGDCNLESDVNGDGAVLNILDLNTLVNYLFRGGAQPATCNF